MRSCESARPPGRNGKGQALRGAWIVSSRTEVFDGQVPPLGLRRDLGVNLSILVMAVETQ